VSKLASVPLHVGQPAPSAHTERKRHVLIVEDNSLIASLMADEVRELGFSVVGPAGSLQEALALAHTQSLDAALVDIRLGVENSFAVAQVLTNRTIPFAFTTGSNEPPEMPFGDVPVLLKPFGTTGLRRALTDLLG
jgi:CheY-like chemotaxis protein